MCAVVCIIATVILVGMCGLITVQNIYYRDRWYPGTTINTVPVAGYTLEKSQEKLEEHFQDYELTIMGRDNIQMVISGDEIDYQIEPDERWTEAFQIQHSDGIILFPKAGDVHAGFNASYDKEALEKRISESVLVLGDEQHEIQEPKSAYVQYDKEAKGYVCVEEQPGNVVKLEELLTEAETALNQGNMTLDLKDEAKHPDVYEKPLVTYQDEKLQTQIRIGNDVARRRVRWKLDSKYIETIEPEKIAKWISFKEGSLKLDQAQMKKWVKKFCKKYCTVGKVRKFKSHTKKKVTISGGDYGWQISEAETMKQLKKSLRPSDPAESGGDSEQELKSIRTITNKPVYLTSAYKKDFDGAICDWDPKNYVEVSLKAQKVYVFRKGKVVYSCPCISGLPVPGRKTRTGVYYIKEHRTNYTMVGEDYRTFVRYWVRITWTGTGFHPASWQPWSCWSKTLYRTNGSHGCINLPPADAEKLYYMLRHGEAVFMH